MGMFDDDERTLFRPPPARGAGGGGGAPVHQAPSPVAQAPQAQEEETTIVESLGYAWRAAGRRKGRTAAICFFGFLATATAAYLAPREYHADGEIVVVLGAAEKAEEGGWDPTKRDRKRKEWEAMVKSQPNLEAIIKDINLVARYDETRSPLQRAKAKLGTLLGDRPMSDEQKLVSLKRTMEAKVTPDVDDARISLSCDWHDPEVARDITERALVRGIDARYEIEVKGTYTDIKDAEEARELKRKELERLSPAGAPAAGGAIELDAAPAVDPRAAEANALREKLAAAQQRFQGLDDAYRQRVADARGKLDEAGKVFGDKHPTIIGLKATFDDARKEPAELEDAKNQVVALRRQMGMVEEVPRAKDTGRAAVAVRAAQVKAQGQLEASDFAAARAQYDAVGIKIDELRSKARSLEANFKRKYTITRHPDVPSAPKRPTGILVFLGGLLLTLLGILGAAALADRMSGLFFEAQSARDALRLPVLGELQEDDLPLV